MENTQMIQLSENIHWWGSGSMTNTSSRDDVKVLNQLCTYISNATGESCGAKTTDIIHGLLGLFSFSLFFLFIRGRGSLVVFFLCNMEFYLSFGRFCLLQWHCSFSTYESDYPFGIFRLSFTKNIFVNTLNSHDFS